MCSLTLLTAMNVLFAEYIRITTYQLKLKYTAGIGGKTVNLANAAKMGYLLVLRGGGMGYIGSLFFY